MTPEELAELIHAALTDLAAAGKTGSLDIADVPAEIKVERPRNREHGDWATNIAMQLGKRAGMNPREFAEVLASPLRDAAGIEAIDIAGPGFMNFRVSAASAGELARTILTAGANYGTGTDLAGRNINLEYVSANPTGPIHVGGARWAATGDSLARILSARGAQVTREYYFNDHGAQIDHFAASLYAWVHDLPVPENGYGGAYIGEIAGEVLQMHSAVGVDVRALPEVEAVELLRADGTELMFAEIKESLHVFRSNFDVFFHEQSLHESGAVEAAIERLRERGVIYEKDGAIWLRSTDFGDDKDRVLIKSDGDAAYFAADLAYYLDKRKRGADQALYILGADHHGYVGRMMAMCAAFGDIPGENLQILIGQLVNLVKGGEPVKLSKRAGNIVTLDDLVEAVGVDAARYALVRVSMDTQVDLDLDVLASRTNDNPVYYVQYAYARTCNVDRNAAEHGVSRDAVGGFDPGMLNAPADAELLAALAAFPNAVQYAAQQRQPHRVAHYLEELAAQYHAWYGQRRVTPRGDDPVTSEHVALLWLNDAVGQVLANGLDLLGVSAPTRM
ncbi:MAG: arginine--tRNA ligase [Varibaculum sp.]|nr:arginine--tRNA ligase [Varibaculum sp.]